MSPVDEKIGAALGNLPAPAMGKKKGKITLWRAEAPAKAARGERGLRF
jgi:hypothetical protein